MYNDDYDTSKEFKITVEEGRALYKYLKGEWIPRDENYDTILRIINGLVIFLAKNELPK